MGFGLLKMRASPLGVGIEQQDHDICVGGECVFWQMISAQTALDALSSLESPSREGCPDQWNLKLLESLAVASDFYAPRERLDDVSWDCAETHAPAALSA